MRAASLFLALVAPLLGNPVVELPYTLVAENVLVGVTSEGAVVSGHYRFHAVPNAANTWDLTYPLFINLPVPVPADLDEYGKIEALVHPVVMIKGRRHFPDKRVSYYRVNLLPRGLKMMVFVYPIERADAGVEVDIHIQYDQPIFTIGGKELVYYLPLIPNFERYRRTMNLDVHSYVINFEGYGGLRLKLASPNSEIVEERPTSVSVLAKDMELVAVERMPGPSRNPPPPLQP
jgi:hypothetical protein